MPGSRGLFLPNNEKLRGIWNLVRMSGHRTAGKERWLLIKEKDEEARTGTQREVTETLTKSVASGRTLEQIASSSPRVWQSNRAARPSPSFHRKPAAGARRVPQEDRISPQLATLVEKAPTGEEGETKFILLLRQRYDIDLLLRLMTQERRIRQNGQEIASPGWLVGLQVCAIQDSLTKPLSLR